MGLFELGDNLPVIIQELAGPGATLVLAGKDRPRPRIKVATRQRGSQRFLPGTDLAVVHAMGTAEEPIELHGRFDDDFLRVFGQSPLDQVEITRGLLYRLNRVRISWGLSIVRVGRVKRFEPTFIRDKVINYSIVLEIDAAEEPRALLRAPPSAVSAQAVRQGIDDSLRIAQSVGAAARAVVSVGNTIGGAIEDAFIDEAA